MATNVLLPQWGMNMEDGLLVKWLVSEGDSVEKGQPLVEVETAKINSELESPETGVVAHIMFDEGATAKVGEIVIVLGEPGESVPRPEPTRPTRSRITPRRTSAQPQVAGAVRGNVQVTPVARKIARENGLNLEGVAGSGPNGRITEQFCDLGVKSGKGFYDWTDRDPSELRKRIAHALIEIEKWAD